MKFTLTIKDNETGEIVKEVETSAIIAGVAESEGAGAIFLTHCNPMEMFGAVVHAKHAVSVALAKEPMIAAILAMHEADKDINDAEEKVED